MPDKLFHFKMIHELCTDACHVLNMRPPASHIHSCRQTPFFRTEVCSSSDKSSMNWRRKLSFCSGRDTTLYFSIFAMRAAIASASLMPPSLIHQLQFLRIVAAPARAPVQCCQPLSRFNVAAFAYMINKRTIYAFNFIWIMFVSSDVIGRVPLPMSAK